MFHSLSPCSPPRLGVWGFPGGLEGQGSVQSPAVMGRSPSFSQAHHHVALSPHAARSPQQSSSTHSLSPQGAETSLCPLVTPFPLSF